MTTRRRTKLKPMIAVCMAGLLSTVLMASAVAQGPGNSGNSNNGGCQETSVGLTAHYINETPGYPLEVKCDIGIFFDQNSRVNNVTVLGTAENAKSEQHGIYVYGANVHVSSSSVTVDADYPGQFISASYQAEASGNFRGNKLEGAHRVGLLIRGDGTDVQVRDNIITGTGAKENGWAENGIQIDQQAQAVVASNVVSDHYWALNNWSSSGILVFDTENVNVQRNSISGGDLGLWLDGKNHNAIHNTIETSSEGDLGIWNDGVYIDGDNIGLRHNTIRALRDGNGDAGVWIFGSNNKLIGNTFKGFGYAEIIDHGGETKRPKPFEP
jgi:hypothetical protein